MSIPTLSSANPNAAAFRGSERQADLRLAQVSFEDNTVLGFIVEESATADMVNGIRS